MNRAHFNSLDVHDEKHVGKSARALEDSFIVPNNNPTTMLYIPVASPPTPAPSPGPKISPYAVLPDSESFTRHFSYDPAHLSRREFANLVPSLRRQYLTSLLSDCTLSELLFVSTTIAPLLKRDFLQELPPEIALQILSFIDDPKTLVRASQVSRRWRVITSDEWIWKRMCGSFRFVEAVGGLNAGGGDDNSLSEDIGIDPTLEWLEERPDWKQRMVTVSDLPSLHPSEIFYPGFSYRKFFKQSYSTMMNWRHGGQLLRSYRLPVVGSDSGVVTSVALDAEYAVVGLANSRIHVFSVATGVLCRTLIGHELGVWAVNLVSRGGFWGEFSGSGGAGGSGWGVGRGRDGGKGGKSERGGLGDDLGEGSGNEQEGYTESLDGNVPFSLRNALGLDLPKVSRRAAADTDSTEDCKGKAWGRPWCPDPGKRSDICCASEGWGQPNALVVSGGCDKLLRVWDVKSGYCIYTLHGHTSTIRCIKVLHNRPIAVTGSRDATLRVWDVQRGRPLRVLQGHSQSVRCLDVCGNRVVSGSYDTTCRLWDVDTGNCLHVLQGHFHQIYSVAFDGVRIASGGLDTTVRIWDADTGSCLALLQGHTALVCQLQLSPTILATGGSDGRVITFSLSTFSALHRTAAHDSSVTSLQFDQHFLVTGGNDGRVRLYETETGNYVRELSEPSESVWKVVYRRDTCAIMCKRAGKTVMEIWSFKP